MGDDGRDGENAQHSGDRADVKTDGDVVFKTAPQSQKYPTLCSVIVTSASSQHIPVISFPHGSFGIHISPFTFYYIPKR